MDLWIGDLVLTSSGEKGKYEGKNAQGKARINVDGDILIVDFTQITKFDEEKMKFSPEDFLEDLEQMENFVSQPKKKFAAVQKYSIDLHIEKLNPSVRNDIPSSISEYQLTAFKDFLSEAFNNKRSPITVIHGKGEGILRQQIHAMLEHDHRVSMTNVINNGGATEIWLRFL